MSGTDHDISEEVAILGRLAQAHKLWRDQRPAPPPPPPLTPEQRREKEAEHIKWMMHKIRNPEPQDVEIIREAPSDPLGTTIWSQLSVLGWRLYAKGGAALLKSIYPGIQRDHHPGFVGVIHKAWRSLGFPKDPRGIWKASDPL